MGIGLGVVTGSLLKLAGPAVETGDLALPAWLPLSEQSPERKDQPGAAADTSGSTSLNRTESLGPVSYTHLTLPTNVAV